ncbi:DUF2237 domain-containing protein [Gymnodinialimonas sp. 2305UL16-5]|uniref:DUF2237 family protein n=1 Tax=Gymnodinialimonas mytili TaxID=3126503 RepID=UPI00309CBEFB
MGFKKAPSLNVFGEALEPCSTEPLTGFFRDGACETCAEDRGSHTVCCTVTAEFLAFSKYVGNDLSTPRPEYGFSGLNPGDGWCVCASRWLQAAEEGAAPPVNLMATHKRALEVIPMELLEAHAISAPS